MIVYAIRNKHTKLFIPAGKARHARTFDEAKSKDKPRLHATLSGCKNTLNMWLKGRWNFIEGIKYTHTRKPEDMEIVAFELTELYASPIVTKVK